MKTPILPMLVALTTSVLLAGCGDSSSSSSSSAPPPPPAPPAPAAAVAETAKKVGAEAVQAVEAAKPQVQEAAATVQKAVADAGAVANQKIADLVAEVKQLIADGKGTEAAQKLKSALSGLKLTPEQQKMIDDLTSQAQASLSKKGVESATKAVGDLLKPKPGN